MKSFLNIIYGVLIGLLVAGIIWLMASQPRGGPVMLLPTFTQGDLIIYVSGAVATPGVYTLPPGSRVDAAIRAAGGFIPGADTDLVNLAEPLEDGKQVNVQGAISTNHINAGRVNINTASVSELDALPGVGPTTAQAIVDYRIQHGSFLFAQDIQNVPGIGPATYNGIKDYIMIGP
jgi:competence protein ComEA